MTKKIETDAKVTAARIPELGSPRPRALADVAESALPLLFPLPIICLPLEDD